MPRFLSIISLFITISAFTIEAADPTSTNFSYKECQGSWLPYPAPEVAIEAPDTLTAVFINHVGRHGSRFPSSPNSTYTILRALERADSLGTITPTGKELLGLTRYVAQRADKQWGALDSLGMAEQRGIASRMFVNYPELFINGKVSAISSYSPRCVMSMYSFTHQLDRLNNKVEITTSAGRRNSQLLRPFDLSKDYTEFIRSKVWETPLNDYADTRITATPLRNILGKDYPLTLSDTRDLAIDLYHFLGGLSAMNIEVDLSRYLSLDEINALWSVYNLRQYLQRTASVLSTTPAEIASPLVLDLIRTTDDAVAGKSDATVNLRFGHAETLLPLFSILHLQGAYYLTNYYDTVAQHFQNFKIVPMGANLQMVLFKSQTGKYYVRFDLNERDITLMPNDERIYIPWNEARDYMIRCLPLIDQP